MKQILIADDEEVVCELYAEELSREGYEVVSTSHCEELMDMIEQYEPDLVVLDIRMGEYDGLNILQEVRKAYYNMPVILCSAYSSYKNDLRSIAADSYVVKSPDLTKLKIEIKTALEARVSLLTDKPIKKWKHRTLK